MCYSEYLYDHDYERTPYTINIFHLNILYTILEKALCCKGQDGGYRVGQ